MSREKDTRGQTGQQGIELKIVLAIALALTQTGFLALAFADNYGPSGNSSSQSDSNPGLAQAKSDYKAYLEQLKAVSAQYKQVTGEVKKVLKEEGVPTWDEANGGIVMKPYIEQVPAPPAPALAMPSTGAYGGADVLETEKDVIVRVDMPGFRKEDIKVSLKDSSQLWVSAARKDDLSEFKSQPGVVYQRLERFRGSFERTIALPVRVADQATHARYENGILTVVIPKLQSSVKEVSVPVR